MLVISREAGEDVAFEASAPKHRPDKTRLRVTGKDFRHAFTLKKIVAQAHLRDLLKPRRNPDDAVEEEEIFFL